MTTKVQPKSRLTFEQYLDFCATTTARYELVRGELQLMNFPTLLHLRIAKFLEKQFDREIERLNFPWEVVREAGQRTEGDSSRLTDVIVLPLEVSEPLLNQSAVFQTGTLLIVEIVSASSATEDYNEKLREYQAKGIPEYWVVNAISKRDKRVTVYTLNASGTYQKQEFRGNQLLVSQTFPSLTLTAEQVLNAKVGA